MKFLDFFEFFLDGDKSSKEIIASKKIQKIQPEINDTDEVSTDNSEMEDFENEFFEEEFYD